MYKNFKLNDGKFEVLFVPNISKIEMIKILTEMAIYKKSLIDNEQIIHHQTSNIKIHFDRIPVDNWNLDGDNQVMPNDIEIKVGKKVKILLPEKTVEENC